MLCIYATRARLNRLREGKYRGRMSSFARAFLRMWHYMLRTQSIPSAEHGVVFGRHGFVPSPLRRRSRRTKFRQPAVTTCSSLPLTPTPLPGVRVRNRGSSTIVCVVMKIPFPPPPPPPHPLQAPARALFTRREASARANHWHMILSWQNIAGRSIAHTSCLF